MGFFKKLNKPALRRHRWTPIAQMPRRGRQIGIVFVPQNPQAARIASHNIRDRPQNRSCKSTPISGGCHHLDEAQQFLSVIVLVTEKMLAYPNLYLRSYGTRGKDHEKDQQSAGKEKILKYPSPFAAYFFQIEPRRSHPDQGNTASNQRGRMENGCPRNVNINFPQRGARHRNGQQRRGQRVFEASRIKKCLIDATEQGGVG